MSLWQNIIVGESYWTYSWYLFIITRVIHAGTNHIRLRTLAHVMKWYLTRVGTFQSKGHKKGFLLFLTVISIRWTQETRGHETKAVWAYQWWLSTTVYWRGKGQGLLFANGEVRPTYLARWQVCAVIQVCLCDSQYIQILGILSPLRNQAGWRNAGIKSRFVTMVSSFAFEVEIFWPSSFGSHHDPTRTRYI